MKRISLLVVAIAILTFLFHEFDLDDRIFDLYYSKTDETSRRFLNKFQLIDKVALKDVSNLSGVVHNPKTNTLFMVMNNPEILLECDLEGKILRRINLEGFHDTEGLCYNNDGNLMVIEERKQVLITLPELGTGEVIKRKDALNILELQIFSDKNVGFEGVAFSPHHKSIFIVKEKSPSAVFQLMRSAQTQSFKRLFEINSDDLYIDDISDIFCLDNGNLLLLSDESSLVVECDINGEMMSYLKLDSGFNGLKDKIPQAEGICMSEKGQLFIVSEPNLLYIYSCE